MSKMPKTPVAVARKRFSFKDVDAYVPPASIELESEGFTKPLNELGDSFALLESSQYSDFSIKCGPYEWKAHRSIICPQSGFFQRLCTWDFKETVEKSITLQDDDPRIVARVLLCLYTGRYPICRLDRPHYYQLHDEFLEAKRRLGVLISVDKNDEMDKRHDLIFHAELLRIADKYDISSLAKMAAERTLGSMRNLSRGVIHPSMMYLYINSIMTAIDVSYSLPSERYKALRPEAVFLAKNCLRTFRTEGGPSYERKFRDLLQKYNDFAWDSLWLFLC